MLILIEGGDAAGKTTTIDLLRQKIERENSSFLTPQNTVFLKSPTSPFAEVWRAMDMKSVDSLTRFYFFRTIAQNDSRVVREYLDKQYNVVLERNIFSTEAFNDTLDEKLKIADPAFKSKHHLIYDGLCRPDVSFLLDVPDDVRQKRIFERAKETKRISWWERPDFQYTFNNKLRQIAKREKMIVINTNECTADYAAETILANITKTRKNQMLSSIVTSLHNAKRAANY